MHLLGEAEMLSKLSSIPRIKDITGHKYNKPDPGVYGGAGHIRQQYLMFYADNFTSSEFVGFVDTDAFFVTYVDREDIFEEQTINGTTRLIPVVTKLLIISVNPDQIPVNETNR